jgi:hypothetical protein
MRLECYALARADSAPTPAAKPPPLVWCPAFCGQAGLLSTVCMAQQRKIEVALLQKDRDDRCCSDDRPDQVKMVAATCQVMTTTAATRHCTDQAEHSATRQLP